MDYFSECIEYFSQKAFKRILEEILKKYQSLGRFAGKAEIKNPTVEELEIASKYLRQDFSNKKSLKIDIKDFEDKINDTKFEGIELERILTHVLKKELVTNKQKAQTEEEARKAMFDGLLHSFDSASVQGFIADIVSNPSDYKLVYSKMDDKSELKMLLYNICIAIEKLPIDTRLRLPVFAADISGDPHYFDADNDGGKLLLKALSFVYDSPYPYTAGERAELLYMGGLLIDELSNFVAVNGLTAYDASGESMVWRAALESKQPLIVPLYNLNPIQAVKSSRPYVIAVENPSVFSMLIEQDSAIPCICINGQPNIAVLIVLDMLQRSGCLVYYSGDFDPEGLLIADKLLKKFSTIRLCCMNHDTYIKSLSQNTLNERRLKILDNIQSIELKALTDIIKIKKLAGYQEKIIVDIFEFIELLTES